MSISATASKNKTNGTGTSRGKKMTPQEQAEFMRRATSGLIVEPGRILSSAGTNTGVTAGVTGTGTGVTTEDRAVSSGGAAVDASNPPMAETNPDTDTQPAQLLQRRVNGQPTDDDMKLINRLSRSGNVDPATLYAFDAAPSTQRVDSYFTRMDITSLQNYARAAALGVPFMNSHRTGGWSSSAELPLGRSFWGGVESDPTVNTQQRFIASSYLLRNNRANGSVNTDDVIAGMEAGVIADVSIGFAYQPGTPQNNFEDRTWLRCSICGGDFLATDWWDDEPDACHHWPGETYDGQLCYMDVISAQLVEFSAVFAGSTPGAVILKAERAAQSGVLTRSQISRLEDTYRVRFGGVNYQVPDLQARVGQSKAEATAAAKRTQETGTDSETVTQDVLTPTPTDKNATATAANGNDNQTQTPNLEEVRKTQMALDKEQLDQARQDAVREQFLRTIKALTTSRTMDDNEVLLVQEAVDNCAAGDMNAANDSLDRLVNYQPSDETLDGDGTGEDGNGETDPADVWPENDQDQVAEDEEMGEVMDEAADTLVASKPDNTQLDDEEAKRAAQVQAETIAAQAATATNNKQRTDAADGIALLKLTISERKQFDALKRDHETLKREVKKLTPLATIGQRYRDDLVAETARQAVRAGLGEEAETLELVRYLPVGQVERLHDHYKDLASARLGHLETEEETGRVIRTGRGGRQTQSADPNVPVIQPGNAGAKPASDAGQPVGSRSLDIRSYR